jgi:DNA replication protein DnaC
LITTLLEARDEKSLLRFRSQLAKQDVVVLDELGYLPASKAGAELLFDLVGQAYERHSLVTTTNLPFASCTDVLDSERLTGGTALADSSLPEP